MLLVFLSAFITVAAGLLLIRKAVWWGLIDIPDARKVHVVPTPRTGGLAMLLGSGLSLVLAVLLQWLPWPALPWQTWLAGAGFIFVGALDDRFSFQPRQKFLVLLLFSALATWPWLVVLRETGVPWLPLQWSASPFVLAVAFPVISFWFMAVPNAVNIEDAINGYMGGFTFILLLALAFRGVDSPLILGALIGFLVLNWPRARHFMGDAGSFGCGFILAESLLRGGGLANPLMALALTAPISMDVAMGLIRRKRQRVAFFTADRATCPHHVLALAGGSTLIATPLLWANAAAFALLAHHALVMLGLVSCYGFTLTWLNRDQLFGRGRSS
jgi:UDP-GlcNAc:undecaprenyl-phosphate GlcNAc-1-phosphate transferase